MIKVLIPYALRFATERNAEVEVSGSTVREIINSLVNAHPDIKAHLFADNDTLRDFINLFVDGKNVNSLQGLDTPVADNGEVMIVPAIAGGSGESTLTNDEISRYSRHLLLPEIGVEGQQKLKAAKVLIIGTGGLGAPLALYLSAAGVGTIGLVDFDVVDESNLQRQIIHSTRDVGRPKVASAKDRIKGVNPLVNVIVHNTMLTSQNALDIIGDYDIVADGTDNFQTRYLVNDACVFLGKPNVYGSVFQFEGQSSVFGAKDGPCYRCLYPSPPPPGLVPSCAEGGVMGVLPGIIGTIQAAETIKLIVGGAKPLVGRLLHFDAWRMAFRELKLDKDENCPVCGKNPSIRELIDYEQFCGLKKNQDSEPIETITAIDLKQRLDKGDKIQFIDIREPHERAIVKFPNAKIMPLGQLVRRMDELDTSIDSVFLCKIGQRSILGIRALREAGYKGRLLNLQDGLNAWARNVDTSMPVY
ncbi:MAG: molybdopterin-synthase adenylyltransferase MoeB [Fibromonadaceae bacterium]|jgi:adenylyltransferase/sulfurtransferase|nr:molybdopterin-synthase adenylyltransferase MoeB [Fibromonadaceae bacterium]